ncbi:MAG: hypothetical protein KDA80_06680 [Planctomycetaceae bacterium]|nr:hypothetical protein [Planctomycetaceae bacterium]
MQRVPILVFALLTGLIGVSISPGAEEPSVATDRVDQSVHRGVDYLKSTQLDDGSWTDSKAVGISALCLHSLLVSGVEEDDPAVKKGLSYLTSHVKPDGGIYHTDSKHRNYETCISIMALLSANRGQEDRKTIDNAVAFVKKLQWDEEEVQELSHPSYGGSGYGSHSRPDLSNTTFFLEALRSAGVSASDPAVQKALIFVSRCQNRESEHNRTEFAGKVNDGGFYYTPAAGGTSQAGANDDGGLRSYASMTYAGLKSMIYAGLTPDDPRVQAAQEWIEQHYTLNENPGLDQQGLFYYYQTFGKTLDILGEDRFEDANGKTHDWRRDLATALISRQKANGSWTNEVERWYEGNPDLATAYSLMALAYTHE